ncbi:hypothetical protein ACQVQY_32285 [Bacillus mycoides]|uniref:hypothetical protein n=1 Tax=Bacillus mycoides TaxID=1405 RepID=UPI003D6573A9
MVSFLFGMCTGVLVGLGLNHLMEKSINRDIDKLLKEKRERLRLLENPKKSDY